MPRHRVHESNKTRFSERLRHWMWHEQGEYEPITSPTLMASLLNETASYKAQGFQISGNTVWNWLYRGTIPMPSLMVGLAELTGISLHEWYELAGVPIPDASPAPLRKRPVPPPEDPWAYALRRAEQDTTIDEGMRAALIQWIRDQAAGYDPQAERRRQEQEYGAPIEHAPASAASDKPDETEEAGPLPAHRETPHPATQERRAPRRRQSAPPRSSR